MFSEEETSLNAFYVGFFVDPKKLLSTGYVEEPRFGMAS
jgi:hypothetical protein